MKIELGWMSTYPCEIRSEYVGTVAADYAMCLTQLKVSRKVNSHSNRRGLTDAT